jgi:hypothetical protein
MTTKGSGRAMAGIHKQEVFWLVSGWNPPPSKLEDLQKGIKIANCAGMV